MQKTIVTLASIAMLSMAFSHAQELDEILDKHFKAIGQEKILNVQTMVTRGKILNMGMELPFKSINKRPDKAYMEMEMEGASIKMAFDGENGWAIQPWTGSAEPMDLSGPDLRPVKEMANMDGSLWKYKEKGHQLELLGSEEVDGAEVFVLKLTTKDGNVYRYYIDKEKYISLKMRTKMVINGMETEMLVRVSDYTDVEGYMMPFKHEQSLNGQPSMTMIYEEVKFNEEIDDAIFSKPAASPSNQP